jgi:hypothetical protein
VHFTLSMNTSSSSCGFEDFDDDMTWPDGLPVYADPLHRQFVHDCRAAGYEVRHYRGRNFWEGPAVITDDADDVARATRVPVQQDNMGLGYVVYPRAQRSGR